MDLSSFAFFFSPSPFLLLSLSLFLVIKIYRHKINFEYFFSIFYADKNSLS